MKVTVLGSADAFHGGGRGHTSLLVDDGAARLLVDCGATTPLALARAGVAPESIDAVLLTHLHGDHFAGVPFLLLASVCAPVRTRPLVIAGPVLTASRVEALYRILYSSSSARPRPFLLDYREIEPEEAHDVAGWRVVSQRAAHMSAPNVALSYRVERGGRVLALTGDTGAQAPLARLAEGADLLVCECTHGAGTDDDAHLTSADVARLRPGWSARRVVLAHLSDAARREAAGISGVEVADDGAVFDV